ncbi:hypothetical protein B0I35DRAFT_433681 [Stachybotrys elegans]|uniref:Uncharacterized protein n=1 Tax=Stachybotrys elegans TaxID=80388 RepID=A0A8K0SM93_9HYPO|nr:hypothetical protein B0I35DRAFT_433681 [Stachybotrys elegans]
MTLGEALPGSPRSSTPGVSSPFSKRPKTFLQAPKGRSPRRTSGLYLATTRHDRLGRRYCKVPERTCGLVP